MVDTPTNYVKPQSTRMFDDLNCAHRHTLAVAAASDVLAYIDWVFYLRQREDERNDPNIEWQNDASFNEIASWLGVDAPSLKPGDRLPSELGTAQLYWPNVTPS